MNHEYQIMKYFSATLGQNLAFFARIHQKLKKTNNFLLKSQRFASSVPSNVTKMV